MNKTLLNMVCSMMFFKNVKLMFWANVVLCAVYMKNRCPSHALKNKTPYEMLYGHISSVRHLRVFGSTCYALIPKEDKSKLDARSQKYIFLGYSNTTKGYHIYDEKNKKFILSRDAIFLESSKNDEIVERKLLYMCIYKSQSNFVYVHIRKSATFIYAHIQKWSIFLYVHIWKHNCAYMKVAHIWKCLNFIYAHI
jgi:hypothetical protein